MRCFIAIALPEEIKAEIGRQQAALRAALAQAQAAMAELQALLEERRQQDGSA